MIYVKKKEIVMDKFEEKIKEALHKVTNGFEVSDEIKERITEKTPVYNFLIFEK